MQRPILLVVAGCLQEEPDTSFPPHDESKSAEDRDFDNLIVSGTLSSGGDEVRLDAKAHNQGPHTFKVSSICSPSWFEDMSDRGGRVPHREGMAYCEAFGLRDFKPGERIPFAATWNGTLWDSKAARYESAPAGNYTWRVAFEVFKGGAGTEYESREQIRLAFDVTLRA